MIPSLPQLLTPVNVDVIFNGELSTARNIGLPETAWQPISVGRECLYINAQLAANFSIAMQSGVAAGGFLSYARDGWLTLCAYEIFDTTRIESASATGRIGLGNSTAVPYTFGAGEVRVLNETNQQTYTNQTGGTVPANGNLNTVSFIADVPGAGSNLTSTDTLSLATTVPGVTPHWVANLVGQNEEGNEALRVRAREANAKASPNGPKDAYNYFAKTTTRPDGSPVGVTRTNLVQANGTSTLYLADPDGPLSTLDRAYVFDNVNLNAVPSGFTLVIPTPSCATKTVDLSIRLTPNPDSSTPHAETEQSIEDAIVAYFATIDVGGAKAQSFKGVYLSTLIQIARDVAGSAVLNVVFLTPAADVTLASAEIPALGTFTVEWTP